MMNYEPGLSNNKSDGVVKGLNSGRQFDIIG